MNTQLFIINDLDSLEAESLFKECDIDKIEFAEFLEGQSFTISELPTLDVIGMIYEFMRIKLVNLVEQLQTDIKKIEVYPNFLDTRLDGADDFRFTLEQINDIMDVLR